MGLTHPQYLVMLALWQHSTAAVRRLGDMLQPRAGHAVADVQAARGGGAGRRDRESGNERALALTLTAKGWQLREEALKIPPAVVSRLGMSIAELMDLHRVLTRVIGSHAARQRLTGTQRWPRRGQRVQAIRRVAPQPGFPPESVESAGATARGMCGVRARS